MKKRLYILKEYLKYKKHIAYVENRVLEVRQSICKQAIIYGVVNETHRELYLKYTDYLKTFDPDLLLD